ncbi:tetratricopeptide repeat protein [Pseudomonas sp. NCHU5208]|uniref:tetratricopeptide repeat protein n=1 Tax=unclassified Pseudomonas TaxID=196821 RepID=UPI003F9B9AA8
MSGSSLRHELPVDDEILIEAHRVGDLGDVSGEVELLSVAGSRGNPQAFYELARIHLNGEGVSKSPEAAVAYLNQAMGMGHDESTRVLGWLYVMGTGVARDLEYGKLLLAKAAETSVRAQREFGMSLANLRSPHLDDIEQGLELLQRASQAGDAEAAAAYRSVFAGEPKAQDVAPARVVATAPVPATPVKERALRGDVVAMYDYALAVSLGKAKEPDAQFFAYCWYSVAASRGHKLAAAEARSLSGVRTIADRESPGRTDRCIADLNAKVDANMASGR